MHAVDGAQQCRLSATGRSDERCHRLRFNREGHVLDGEKLTVQHVDVIEFNDFSHVFFRP